MGPDSARVALPSRGVNCLMQPNGCSPFDASRTSGVVYGIAAVQFRFLEKKLNQISYIKGADY